MQPSFLPKAAGIRQWLSKAYHASRPEKATAARQWKLRGGAAGALLGIYILIALLTYAGFNGVHTATWMAGRIPWIFAPVGVFLAVAGLLRATGWSIAGYLIGTIIGEMIGTPLYNFQNDYLQARLEDPAFVQHWTPIHPSWWIAVSLFLYITIAAAIVEWRDLGRNEAMSSSSEATR